MPEDAHPRATTGHHDDELPVEPDVPVPRDPVRWRWDVLLVISVGGALGSLARWGVGELVPWSGNGFPWATFIENVSGGLALGALMVFLLDVWPPHRYLRPFLGVGLLGGYTTFSTYMLESRDLLASGEAATAFTYLAGSLVTGLTAVWLGIASARAAVGLAQRRRRHRQTENPTNRQPDRRSRR